MALEFSAENLPKKIFINNDYVDSKSSKKLAVYNPKNGELIANDVSLAGEEDVDAAVDAAEKAFPAWKKMSALQRRGIMNKFADLIEQNAKEIAQLSRISLGSPAAFGAFEIGLCAEVRDLSSPAFTHIVISNVLSRLSDTTPASSTSLAVSRGLKKTASSRLCGTDKSPPSLQDSHRLTRTSVTNH
jgi:hypothetical protein